MSQTSLHVPGKRRFVRRVSGAVALLAMGSWVVLAAIPMVVAIMALS